MALRLSGVTEATGRFVSREGSNLWVKTPEGRVSVPIDPERPLARRTGDRYLPYPSLTLRAGDRLRWWKNGAGILALWVETDAEAVTFERESSWTEWVRRASGRELARRMSGRVAGKEVREVTVTRRTPAGRARKFTPPPTRPRRRSSASTCGRPSSSRSFCSLFKRPRDHRARRSSSFSAGAGATA